MITTQARRKKARRRLSINHRLRHIPVAHGREDTAKRYPGPSFYYEALAALQDSRQDGQLHIPTFDALVASCAEVLSEAPDVLTGEERIRVYRMLQLEVRPDPEGYEVSGAFRTDRPTGRGRSASTKRAELRFCALLTEGNSRMIFFREGFGRLKENLA